MKYLEWLLRGLIAIILVQTLYFKFSGAPESVYIFSTMGVEPWGRYLTGFLELVAAACVVFSHRLMPWGALLSLGLMAGAIGTHLFTLGVEVQGDGGLLFALAMVVFISSLILVWRHKLSILAKFR